MEEAITDEIVKSTQECIDTEGAGVGGTNEGWVAQGQPLGAKAGYEDTIVDIQTDTAGQFIQPKEPEAIRGSYGTDGTQITVENQQPIPQSITEIPDQLKQIEQLENKY